MSQKIDVFGEYFSDVAGIIAKNSWGKDVVFVVDSGVDCSDVNDVNFIDYDGSILHSYTGAEAQALTALPKNPYHNGLVSQGWNWTLAQIKDQLTNVGGPIYVGQLYVTESGDTELYVEFYNASRMSPALGICVNGSVTIDWGDGSSVSTVSGNSYTTILFPQHSYSSVGKYIIKIHVVSGGFSFKGEGNSTTSRNLISSGETATINAHYNGCLLGVRIGNNAGIGDYAFSGCKKLEAITIPSSVTSIGTYAFYGDSISAVTIPNITTLPQYIFAYCYNLLCSIPYGITGFNSYVFNSTSKPVTIPNSVTTIAGSAFYMNSHLGSIVIPASVTSIGYRAFYNCESVVEYHFKGTTPPTLDTQAFDGISSFCKIYVPSSAVSTYKSATNWTRVASYIEGE